MGVCRQYQISHSYFLGGPPRWTEDDQDKALAYERYTRAKCGNCNTSLEEWEEDQFAYVGHQWRCPGCEIIEQERGTVPEDQKGVQVGIIPREAAEALESKGT